MFKTSASILFSEIIFCNASQGCKEHSNLATTQKHYAAIKQESVEAKLRDAWKNSALNLGENAVNTNLARYEKSGQGGICYLSHPDI